MRKRKLTRLKQRLLEILGPASPDEDEQTVRRLLREAKKKRREPVYKDPDLTEIFLWWRDRPEVEDEPSRHFIEICPRCGEVVVCGEGEKHWCRKWQRAPFIPGSQRDNEDHPQGNDQSYGQEDE